MTPNVGTLTEGVGEFPSLDLGKQSRFSPSSVL